MILTDGDLSLINLLKVNARASVSELARQLGVSRTTAQDRLTRLEEKGVITGYTVRLSAETSEAGVSAYVMISFEPRSCEHGIGPRIVNKAGSRLGGLTQSAVSRRGPQPPKDKDIW